MTTLLCLSDSYQKECDAIVTAVEGNFIELDQTVFFPRGGGQPSDFGFVSVSSLSMLAQVSSQANVLGKNVLTIKEVYKKDGKIIHEMEGESHDLVVGVRVHCVIDWERRYKLMRTHTAAHVLASYMHDKLGYQITGNQLETDKTRFDFSMEGFDRAKFDEAVNAVNEILTRDIELKVYSLPKEEAMKIPGVVKLAGALPPEISMLRIVEIPGIDLQADGGTHVKNLKEVGKVTLTKLDNKGSQNKRIYFTLSP